MEQLTALALGSKFGLAATPALLPDEMMREGRWPEDTDQHRDLFAPIQGLPGVIREFAPRNSTIAWDSLGLACALLRQSPDQEEAMSLDNSLSAQFDVIIHHGASEGLGAAVWAKVATAVLDDDTGSSMLQQMVLKKCTRSLGHAVAQRLVEETRSSRELSAVVDSNGNSLLHLAVLSEDSEMVRTVIRWARSPSEVRKFLESRNGQQQRPVDLVRGIERTTRPVVRLALKEAYTHASHDTPHQLAVDLGHSPSDAPPETPFEKLFAEHGWSPQGNRSHGALWQIVHRLRTRPTSAHKLVRHDKSITQLLDVASDYHVEEVLAPEGWADLATALVDENSGRTIVQEIVAQRCSLAFGHHLTKRLLRSLADGREGVWNVLDANGNNLIHLAVACESTDMLLKLTNYCSSGDLSKMIVAQNDLKQSPLDVARTLSRSAKVSVVKAVKEIMAISTTN